MLTATARGSMGGAVAAHLGANAYLPSLTGLVVVDVVEGSALEALASMGRFIKSRPVTFPSLEEAIKWSVNRSMCFPSLADGKEEEEEEEE